MLETILPAVISGGSRILGGILGGQQQDKNAALQREFAQNSISWRVADAKRAGIHPLYALGAPAFSPAVSSSSPMGEAVAGMGQDISRAMMATSNNRERQTAVGIALENLGLQRAQLQNDLLATQIAKLKGQIGPPMPTGDMVGPEAVPESNKIEPRTPLFMGGTRIKTDPGTSNMEDFEKRYGDEGPVNWMMTLGVAWQDLVANYGQPQSWPGHIVREGWRRLSEDLKSEFGNFENYLKWLGGPNRRNTGGR